MKNAKVSILGLLGWARVVWGGFDGLIVMYRNIITNAIDFHTASASSHALLPSRFLVIGLHLHLIYTKKMLFYAI